MRDEGMRSSLAALLVISLLVSCGPESKHRSVTIRGVNYHFPVAHDPSVILEREGAFGAFADVSPPGEPFELRFSHRHYRPNRQGEEVPTIHWVNDANAEATVVEHDGQMVVCAVTHPLAHYTCGVQVLDAGLRWAAVFDRDQAPNAAKIRAKAQEYLRTYRRETPLRKES